MPKGVRLKLEQVVAKLREIKVKLSQGKDVLTACREADATDKSFAFSSSMGNYSTASMSEDSDRAVAHPLQHRSATSIDR